MRRAPGVIMGLLAGTAALLQGCATPPPVEYGPVGEKAPWGYKDTLNADGGYTVRVSMPGTAAPDLVRSFWNRRADELCPGGTTKRNIFRSDRQDSTYAPAIYGSASVAQRSWVSYTIEGYVYCKPEAAKEPAATAG